MSKALCAEQAGAVGVIVTERQSEHDATFIEMITDGTDRQPNIPAYFLLGRNGDVIRDTLLEQRLAAAIINIPINLTNTPIKQLNQPPWIVW